MTDLPPLLMLATTYFPPDDRGGDRAVIAQRTINSWRERLRYDGPTHLHVADDGSLKILVRIALERGAQVPAFDTMTTSVQARHGVGASLNEGIEAQKRLGAVMLYAVDDWLLTTEFDVTPWVQLLLDDKSVGAVRLGPAHPGLTGTVAAFPSGWGLRLNRHNFVASQRPTLFHQRFWDAYGRWPEDVNAYECERIFNERFCEGLGPDVVLALPHPWQHQDGPELADIDPTKG